MKRDDEKRYLESLQRDELKLLEVITQINNNFSSRISSLKKLNWKQLRSEMDTSNYYLQLREFENLVNAMDDLITMLDFLKNYTRYFLYEAKNNLYVSPEFKSNILASIKNRVESMKDKVNRIFIEFQILFDEISRG